MTDCCTHVRDGQKRQQLAVARRGPQRASLPVFQSAFAVCLVGAATLGAAPATQGQRRAFLPNDRGRQGQGQLPLPAAPGLLALCRCACEGREGLTGGQNLMAATGHAPGSLGAACAVSFSSWPQLLPLTNV